VVFPSGHRRYAMSDIAMFMSTSFFDKLKQEALEDFKREFIVKNIKE
jgi:hypothetical protein